MRKIYLLIVILVLLSMISLNPSVVAKEKLPPWVKTYEYPIRSLHGINESQYYGSGGFYTYVEYKPVSLFIDTYDENGILMPMIKVNQRVDPINGILYFYSFIPYVSAKITVIEEKSWKNTYDLTPLCLTHIDKQAKEMLLLRIHVEKIYNEIQQTANMNFYVEWLHVKYDPKSGQYTTISLDKLWAYFGYNDTRNYYNAYTLEIALTPEFYYTTEYDNETNTTKAYLIFGFNFTFNLYVYGVADSYQFSEGLGLATGVSDEYGSYYGAMGSGYFAWDTYLIAENSTYRAFSENLKRIFGWYSWIGTGIKYYIPWGSEYDTMTSYIVLNTTDTSDLNRYLNEAEIIDHGILTGSTGIYKVMGSLVETNEYRADSMRIKFIVEKVKAYNYIVDVDKLYAFFVYGLLQEYTNAEIVYSRYQGSNRGSTLASLLVLASPFLAIYVIALPLRRKEIFPIGFLIGAIIGFVIGIYVLTDILIAILTFITYILLNIKTGGSIWKSSD